MPPPEPPPPPEGGVVEAHEARPAVTSPPTTSVPPPSPGPQPGPLPSSSSMPSSRPESCVKYFDALWWCYSPGHQLRQFYRHGDVDDCSSSWKDLWDCLSARTVRFKEDADAAAAAAAAGRATHPLWRLRTPDEAAAWWAAEFGHVGQGGAEQQHPPAGGGGGGGVHASGGEATP